jgi:hypothetical protein
VAVDPSGEGEEARETLRRYVFDLALRVLRRSGFGPLSRPTFLRIGFRDICRDLDLHEGTSVRIVMGQGRITRAVLDPDGNALLFRTAFRDSDPVLEDALSAAFPNREIRRLMPGAPTQGVSYQVRFPLALTFLEARGLVAEIREGLAQLLARFEPRRFRALKEVIETFGSRETLGRFFLREPREVSQRIPSPPQLGGTVVH